MATTWMPSYGRNDYFAGTGWGEVQDYDSFYRNTRGHITAPGTASVDLGGGWVYKAPSDVQRRYWVQGSTGREPGGEAKGTSGWRLISDRMRGLQQQGMDYASALQNSLEWLKRQAGGDLSKYGFAQLPGAPAPAAPDAGTQLSQDAWRGILPSPVPGEPAYTGGSKDFNENTGQYEPGWRDKPGGRVPVQPTNPGPVVKKPDDWATNPGTIGGGGNTAGWSGNKEDPAAINDMVGWLGKIYDDKGALAGAANPWFEYLRTQIAPGLGLAYSLQNGPGNAGAADWSRNLFNSAGAPLNTASGQGMGQGGWMDYGQFGNLMRELLSKGSGQGSQYGSLEPDAQMSLIQQLAGTGGAMASNNISRMAMLAQLKDLQRRYGSANFAQDPQQTLMDYVRNSGFLQNWGLG